jgi:hypothetical protein
VIRLLVVLSLLGVGTLAHAAQESDAEARARAHYEVGLGMYHLGNYRDAVREFTAGYDLSPRAEFLINLGQAYRKLHEVDKAREMFRRYLAESPHDVADRRQVESLLAEMDREAAQAPTLAPGAVVVSAPAPAPEPSPSHRRLRHLWWIVPTSVVVVGTVLGVSLGLGLPPSQVRCSDASIGCVDTRR